MRWKAFPGLIMLALSPLCSAQGQPLAEDAATTARVETMFLLNEHLNPFNINTNTEAGIVTLTGSVDDEIKKQLAEDLAKTAKGVRKVENNITIVPNAYSDKDRRSWRQKITDKTTTAAVKANLLYNSEFHGLKVGVETVNGIVTLHGNVYNEAQMQRIEEIAMDARGVEKVINNLTVYAPETVDDAVEHTGRQLTDEWLEARVEAAVLLNRHLSIRELDVEVDDGICFLSGNVDSEAERTLATSIAQSIKGVGEVRNNIRLRDTAVEVTPSEPVAVESLPVEVPEIAVDLEPLTPSPELAPETRPAVEVQDLP